MGSSRRLDFMTELKPEVNDIKAIASEEHNTRQCRYIKRSKMRNVNGKERELLYWIRSCGCGNEVDHSDLLDVNSDKFGRADGFEIHLREDCEWMQSTIGKLFVHTKQYEQYFRKIKIYY